MKNGQWRCAGGTWAGAQAHVDAGVLIGAGAQESENDGGMALLTRGIYGCPPALCASKRWRFGLQRLHRANIFDSLLPALLRPPVHSTIEGARACGAAVGGSAAVRPPTTQVLCMRSALRFTVGERTGRRADGFAPARKRATTISSWPFAHAMYRGVAPPCEAPAGGVAFHVVIHPVPAAIPANDGWERRGSLLFGMCVAKQSKLAKINCKHYSTCLLSALASHIQRRLGPAEHGKSAPCLGSSTRQSWGGFVARATDRLGTIDERSNFSTLEQSIHSSLLAMCRRRKQLRLRCVSRRLPSYDVLFAPVQFIQQPIVCSTIRAHVYFRTPKSAPDARVSMVSFATCAGHSRAAIYLSTTSDTYRLDTLNVVPRQYLVQWRGVPLPR